MALLGVEFVSPVFAASRRPVDVPKAAPPTAPHFAETDAEPLAALADEPLSPRFCAWLGALGRRYLCSVYAPRACPAYCDAALIAVAADAEAPARRASPTPALPRAGRRAPGPDPRAGRRTARIPPPPARRDLGGTARGARRPRRRRALRGAQLIGQPFELGVAMPSPRRWSRVSSTYSALRPSGRRPAHQPSSVSRDIGPAYWPWPGRRDRSAPRPAARRRASAARPARDRPPSPARARADSAPSLRRAPPRRERRRRGRRRPR